MELEVRFMTWVRVGREYFVFTWQKGEERQMFKVCKTFAKRPLELNFPPKALKEMKRKLFGPMSGVTLPPPLSF